VKPANESFEIEQQLRLLRGQLVHLVQQVCSTDLIAQHLVLEWNQGHSAWRSLATSNGLKGIRRRLALDIEARQLFLQIASAALHGIEATSERVGLRQAPDELLQVGVRHSGQCDVTAITDLLKRQTMGLTDADPLRIARASKVPTLRSLQL